MFKILDQSSFLQSTSCFSDISDMKKWIQKLINQFETESDEVAANQKALDLSEERASLLYMIDIYSQHLVDFDSSPARKVREIFDEFVKDLLKLDREKDERTLFRFRQYFASYRIEEYSYVQKTFDDFRGIIWDFVDQLSDDLKFDKAEDNKMLKNLDDLKDAVEANSIDSLRSNARLFIDNYIEMQSKRDRRKTQRMDVIKKNLESVRKQLVEANDTINLDHLTKAFNRKSFDEQMRKNLSLYELSKKPTCLVMVDIDHFKKVNDTYGHAIGDFVIQECAKMLKEVFYKPSDFVARIGGEEFAVILSDQSLNEAKRRAEEALNKIRQEAFVQDNVTIRFTVSMGLALLTPNENVETWMRRADQALYDSKHNGRNRLTIAGVSSSKEDVA